YFIGPLFTDFCPGPHPGALDWYTVSLGILALAVLAAHGAMFLRWKTSGDLAARATRLAKIIWPIVAVLAIVVGFETWIVRPEPLVSLGDRPLAWVLPLAAITGGIGVFIALRRGRELGGFIASCVVIAALLGTVAAAVYPHVLASSVDPAWDLDVEGAANGHHTLAIGLVWWIPAITLAIGYFVYVFRSFRGKVELDDH
ncbi:MAG TPA: cytochrome d ubiquinol oxidase subunit II, partial [Kofleriaceae bacterium]